MCCREECAVGRGVLQGRVCCREGCAVGRGVL